MRPEPRPSKRGRPPKLSSGDLIEAFTWHVLQPSGTFSANLALHKGVHLSDSSLSERRQSLGPALWTEALDHCLRRAACQTEGPPASSYRGFRLVGVDGTTFPCANTPTIKHAVRKTRARRGAAAFFRLSCVALCELGTHRPLAVQIGQNEESEAALAAQIVGALKEDDLLIADRYYGNGKWVGRLFAHPCAPMFLLRVQERFGAHSLKVLEDGSRLVHVMDPQTGERLLVRDIKAKVRRQGGKWTWVRFWTNLLDADTCPANDLIGLYALRWEQEIAFRELKQHLQGKPLLASHTLPTAVQEICALFMAQAIVASARTRVATEKAMPVLAVSFEKTLAACRRMGWLWAIAGKTIGQELWETLVEQVTQDLVRQASKPRRARSCPRKVRQPIKKWPRLMKNTYERGAFEAEIRKS